MNGLSLTLGVMQPWNSTASSAIAETSTGSTDTVCFKGQGSYSWTGDFAGKVWAGFFQQEVTGLTGDSSTDATAFEVGVSTSIANINLVAYGYSGEGVGTTGMLSDGFSNDGKTRDSDGGYVQATYVIPMGTKLGVSYGVSSLDDNAVDAGGYLVADNNRVTDGAYHPLTKHLNLVAEYNNMESKAQNGNSRESDTISLGAILFF